MILHQIEALANAGVKDIVLAVNYRPEMMTAALKKYEQEYGVRIEYSVETEPLGTAGPLKLAERILGKDDSPLFVLNSDVICDYPFKELAEFHKAHGNEGTIVVTKVEEPSKYGVVVHKPDHPSRIDRFVEKPVEFVGNRINAGLYILNPSILKRIELRPTSIEQETFPEMVRDGQLHSFDLEGYWMDVGQPKDFLSGTCLYLSSLTKKGSKLLTPASEPFVNGGNVMIDPSAKIGQNCKIGPNVTIGPNVVIGDGVRLQRCVLLAGSKVKEHAWIKSTIVGWNSTVGRWARLENVSVLGDDVTIGDEIYCNGASVLPHKSIKANVDSEYFPNLTVFMANMGSGANIQYSSGDHYVECVPHWSMHLCAFWTFESVAIFTPGPSRGIGGLRKRHIQYTAAALMAHMEPKCCPTQRETVVWRWPIGMLRNLCNHKSYINHPSIIHHVGCFVRLRLAWTVM